MKTPADYEMFVQQVVEELSADGTVVYHHREFTGRVSGRKIVADVSFDLVAFGGARLLVVVECKRYTHRVEVGDVEEFHSKLDDIGAHKGIMVTTVGYQQGAIATARGRGIALALLTDEAQPGELDPRLIVARGGSPYPPAPQARPPSPRIFQGNIQPWGELMGTWWDGGIRFDSFSSLWTTMVLSLDDAC